VWNTSILVLSKHRKAVFIFMIITTRRDKDYTSRPSPNRNCLLQPCLSGGETWGWGRGRLVPINTQQLTEPRERGRPKKKTEQRPSKKKQSKTEHTKFTHREESALSLPSSLQKTTQKSIPTETSIFVLVSGKTEGKGESHQQPSSPSPETESSRTPPTLQPSSQSPETGAPVSICFCSSVFKLHLNSAKVI